MNKTPNQQCGCGGVLEVKLRANPRTSMLEEWTVCPFCQAQRPVVKTPQVQGDDPEDRVLTQPARG